MKLNKIELGGFRGVRNQLIIPLPSSSSLLLYGENGGGKSSVTDGLEWFFYDRVNHLSSQEIGRNGIPALRNMSLNHDEDAFVALDLTDPVLSAKKTLSIKKSRYLTACSNSSLEFKVYGNASRAENIILRYRDLLEFILFTKADKLAEVSRLIGFGEVTKTKKTLRKTANDLGRLERARGYDKHISRQQAEIIEHLGQNITTEAQFVEAAKSLLKPLHLTVDVTDGTSLEEAIAQVKSPADDKAISLGISYGNVFGALQAVQEGRDACRSLYREFYDKHKKMREDSEKLSGLGVARLLAEGVSVLEGTWEQDSCPLCLQPKDRIELLAELKNKQEQLAALRKEHSALEEAKDSTAAVLREFIGKVDPAALEHCLGLDGNEKIKVAVEAVSKSLAETLKRVSDSSVFGDADIVAPEDFLAFGSVNLSEAVTAVEEERKATGEKRREDQRFAVAEKLSLAKKAYREVISLRDEQAGLRRQIDSMESICREFVKQEKEALTHFLTGISKDINDLYLFMNADERVEGIRLVPLGDKDEFVGITLEMTFHGETVSPPETYLSESHVNCLGICLFLATAMAFNKVNRFLVLDDVISSFDTDHRARFGHLLRERFSNYQILLFTHERTWLDYMTSLVKGVGWEIRRVVWDDDAGVVLKPAPVGPRSAIETRLAKSDTEGLGNTMRIYLERLLKKICANLEVKLTFLYNDRNEDRMAGEMLSALMATLKRRECELKAVPVVRRMRASTYLANRLSHDTSLVTTTGDLKALWADVDEFERLFVCGKCSRMITTKKVDSTTGTIICRCGTLKYGWKG